MVPLVVHGDFLLLVIHTYQENGFQCALLQSLRKPLKNLSFTKMENFAWANSLSLENLIYLWNGCTSKKHFPCPSCKLIMSLRPFACDHLLWASTVPKNWEFVQGCTICTSPYPYKINLKSTKICSDLCIYWCPIRSCQSKSVQFEDVFQQFLPQK